MEQHSQNSPPALAAARFQTAVAATVGSVGAAVVIDATEGTLRQVLAGAAALLAVLATYTLSRRIRGSSRPSLEHLFLMGISLVAAVLVMKSASGWLYDWRVTAAVITATAPNWYIAAANAWPAPPARPRRPANPVAAH